MKNNHPFDTSVPVFSCLKCELVHLKYYLTRAGIFAHTYSNTVRHYFALLDIYIHLCYYIYNMRE